MAWTDIFTKTANGHAVTLSKAFINHKAEYTVRFGAEKKDDKGTFVSPNFPLSMLSLPTLSELVLAAEEKMAADIAADAQAEAERVKALSAKPSAQAAPTFKPKGPPGVAAPKVPGAPRATGKTAKKKAKLAARADAAKASA